MAILVDQRCDCGRPGPANARQADERRAWPPAGEGARETVTHSDLEYLIANVRMTGTEAGLSAGAA